MSTQQFSFKFSSGELFNAASWASIFSRFAWSHPSNVVRGIGTINVNSIEHVSRWSVANVGNKIRKCVPTFANFYAYCAIPFIAAVVLVVTSITHAFPCLVKIVFFSIMSGMSVSEPAIALYTSAGFGVASSKSFSGYDGQLTTIAFTFPLRSTGSIFVGWLNCNQSSETLSCDIFVPGHRTAPIGLVSSGGVSVQALTPLRTIARS